MATEILMPQLSDTMNEGKILTWLKKEGEKVIRGDALAEVATDKADLEIESFHEGTLLQIKAPVGTTVKVGTVIAVVGQIGETVAETKTESPSVEPAQTSESTIASAVNTQSVPAASVISNGSDRIKVSPLAKNLARTHGVDLAQMVGSGEGGRIVRKDIEGKLGKSVQTATSASSAVTQKTGPVLGGTGQELSKMRQTIAQRMVESATTVPHFYVTTKVNVDVLIKTRNSLKALPQYEGITFNHLIIKATGLALRKYPRINASYMQGRLVQPGMINVGIITALEDGLLIPVVKNADQIQLVDIVSEAKALVQRARAGRPKSDDLVGGTFCISNMGANSVENFTAIISPGQGGILAVSAILEEPVVVGGEIKVGSVMRLTLSVDHRIIDGVVAGQFVSEVKSLLEDPVLLLA